MLAAMTAITGFAHVTLSVTDLERSTAWYAQVLGFTPTATEDDPRWSRTLCVHQPSGTILVLQRHAATTGPGPFDERRTGLDHLALRVGALDDLHAWQERLGERAVPFTPITDTGRGGKVVTFRDPDGIALELFHRPA